MQLDAPTSFVYAPLACQTTFGNEYLTYSSAAAIAWPSLEGEGNQGNLSWSELFPRSWH